VNNSYLYQYPPLTSGILLKRYKRFLADIQLDSGEVITAHCANTGPMIGVCEVGKRVQLSHSNNPKRKLAYSWEMIELGEKQKVWVGINTGLPNKIIKIALENNLIPELAGQYDTVKSEVKFGQDNKSRIDFVLKGENNQKPIYLEVKNTTLTHNNLALFPDTETTRGQKHLRELIALCDEAIPVMLYFINRSDCDLFAPGREFDPKYGALFDEAREKGVKILPCRFDVSPEGVKYLGLAKIID